MKVKSKQFVAWIDGIAQVVPPSYAGRKVLVELSGEMPPPPIKYSGVVYGLVRTDRGNQLVGTEDGGVPWLEAKRIPTAAPGERVVKYKLELVEIQEGE